MSELKVVDLKSFLFSSLFYFSFHFILFLDLELGVSMMLHVTVTKCHKSITCYMLQLHDHVLYRIL